MSRLGLICTVVLVLTTVLLTTSAAAPAHAETPPGPAGPPQRTFPAALAYGSAHPNASPPGANDFSCEPTVDRPRPVVLVHGTFETAYTNWAELSPTLAAEGYCVFALNYGGPQGAPYRGTTDIPASAQELAGFVEEVLAATGADEVDLVGHSQGGMMPRYYLKELGGAAHVHHLVGLAPSNHGTTLFGLLTTLAALPGGEDAIGIACLACAQQRQGSAFNADLDAGGDTVPGVEYTVLVTRYDEVVTPYTNGFLVGSRVTNVELQDVCVLDHTDHLGISYDPIAIRLVRNALHPPSAVAPTCTYVPPIASSQPAPTWR